jgi:hypothetical protein
VSAQGPANLFGQRGRVGLAARTFGQRFQDLDEMTKRDPFPGQALQDVGEQDRADQLRNDLANKVGMGAPQTLEQRLGFLNPDKHIAMLA